MYVILVYDVNAKRTTKLMKICRRYLTHMQRSVFEGRITEAKLGKLKKEIKTVCHNDEDSVMIYEFNSLKYATKEVIGTYTSNDNIF